MGRPKKILPVIKQRIIVAGHINPEIIINNHNHYTYKYKRSLKVVRRLRNSEKLLRVYINGKKIGYVYLDKINRDLYIDGDIINISTSY